MNDSYSAQTIKSSLKYFALGKGIGALIGVGWLLLLVRALSKTEYGIYVGLVAYLELFVVLSNFGLVPISERFVPEWRIKNEIGKLKGIILFLFKARLLTVCLIALLAAIAAYLLADIIGIEPQVHTFIIFQIIVAAESFARFIETIFDSLMLQGRAQISLFSRTGTRLIFLVLAIYSGHTLTLQNWVIYEAIAYSIGLIVTIFILLVTYQKLGDTPAEKPDVKTKIRFGLSVYGSHVLGVVSGIDVVKLLAIKIAGAEATAVFGFCSSLAWMLQRYLPSFLLVGMIRPLIVASAVSVDGQARLERITSIVIKLNAMIIGCGLVLSLVLGDEIIAVLSGNKFHSGGMQLSLFLLFTFTQTLHAVIGYIGLAKNQGKSMFFSKLVSSLVLVIVILCQFWLDIYAYSLALVISDLTWFYLVYWWLSKSEAGTCKLPIKGLTKISLLIITVSLTGIAIQNFVYKSSYTFLATTLACVLLCLTYALLGLLIKPFGVEERNSINRFLPAKLFLW